MGATGGATDGRGDLARRVALVTGAGQGLGAAIAESLHEQGARVVLVDRASTAESVAASLDPDAEGSTAVALQCDVADEPAAADLVATVAERWHSPDILVNNAAVTVTGSVWDVDLDEWDQVMATNLRSQLSMTRLCASAMRERGWGRVVNLASLAGQAGGLVAGPHYAASKAGVLVLTKIFAKELAAHGVTVNAVAPAAVRTPVMDAMPESRVSEIAGSLPVGRVGRADEVAGLVAYLCGEAAGYITGSTMDINGGALMR